MIIVFALSVVAVIIGFAYGPIFSKTSLYDSSEQFVWSAILAGSGISGAVISLAKLVHYV